MKAAIPLLDAAAFLTALPISSASVHLNPVERLNRALGWFPLIGALIGWITAMVVSWGVARWSVEVGALLGLTAMAGLTGGLHLDGFTDTLDGWAARADRVETLRVMRDARVGAIGAMGLMLLMTLKWMLIKSIPLHRLAPVLVSSCALSRWAMVASAKAFPYVPGESGLGKLFTTGKAGWQLLAAGGLAFGLSVVCLGLTQGIGSILLAGAIVFSLNPLMVRRLGGITGDTLGAVNEVVEISLLLFLSIR